MPCRVRVPFSRFIHASEVHRAERVKTSKHTKLKSVRITPAGGALRAAATLGPTRRVHDFTVTPASPFHILIYSKICVKLGM